MSGTTWESDLRSWVGADFQAMPRSEGGVALCGACMRTGECRLGITQEELRDDDVLTSNLMCPPDHEGGPNVAHGGWTAAVMDEMLGHVPIAHNQLSVTATLTVDFKKPVPIGRPLQVRAWIDRIEGQKWFISGELVLLTSGAVLAAATGIWIARDVGHFARYRAWLAEQDSAAEQSTQP
jgi:acyl-CoA thioesterase FadM